MQPLKSDQLGVLLIINILELIYYQSKKFCKIIISFKLLYKLL